MFFIECSCGYIEFSFGNSTNNFSLNIWQLKNDIFFSEKKKSVIKTPSEDVECSFDNLAEISPPEMRQNFRSISKTIERIEENPWKDCSLI